MSMRFSRRLAIAGAASLAVVGAVFAQSLGTPADELLLEVRALRAELNQAAGTSLRAQLLVARLQLQEQRLSAEARQLNEVQEKLSNTERALIPLAAQLKGLQEAADAISPEQRRDMEQLRVMLKTQVEQMRKGEQELRGQEAALTAHLAESQSRWAEFNERLDELERMLPARPR